MQSMKIFTILQSKQKRIGDIVFQLFILFLIEILQHMATILTVSFYSKNYAHDYIDYGDGCWRRKVLITPLRCWRRFCYQH